MGPAAHSGFGTERRWNIREWSAYELAVREGRPAMEGSESLDPEAVALEDLYLGLRVSEGVAEETLPPGTVTSWVAQAWARQEGGRVALTAEGFLRLDALVGSLIKFRHARTPH